MPTALSCHATCRDQGRAELLCVLLASVCLLVPEIEERLKEALPGRGRQKTADTIAGATNGFFLPQDAQDKVKQVGRWWGRDVMPCHVMCDRVHACKCEKGWGFKVCWGGSGLRR